MSSTTILLNVLTVKEDSGSIPLTWTLRSAESVPRSLSNCNLQGPSSSLVAPLIVRRAWRSVVSWWNLWPDTSWPSLIHLTVGLGLPVNGILNTMSSPFSKVQTSLNLGGTLIFGGAKIRQIFNIRQSNTRLQCSHIIMVFIYNALPIFKKELSCAFNSCFNET